MEHYYAAEHPAYRPLPPYDGNGATRLEADQPMQVIYPEAGSTLYVPIELNGEPGHVVLSAAHRQPGAMLHWDLDGAYLGSTTHLHQRTTSLTDGAHRITLTDADGAQVSVAFRAVSSRDRR